MDRLRENCFMGLQMKMLKRSVRLGLTEDLQEKMVSVYNIVDCNVVGNKNDAGYITVEVNDFMKLIPLCNVTSSKNCLMIV